MPDMLFTRSSQLSRNLLLSAHLGSSAGLLGAALALVTLGTASVGGADPATIYPAARLIVLWLLAPLSLLALGTGLILVVKGRWGFFIRWWVTLKLAIVAVLMAAVFLILMPRLDRTAVAVTGPAPPQLGAVERLPLLIGSGVASTLLLVALVLGISKPAWRLRRGPTPATPRSGANSDENSLHTN